MKKISIVIALVLCAVMAIAATPAKKSAPATAKKAPAATAKKAPAANAKKAPGPGRMFGFGLSDPDTQKQLGLTADQKKKLEALNKTYMAKFDAQRKNMPVPKMDKNNKPTQADMQKFRKQMEAGMKLRQEYEAAQNKILTKAQLTKYEAIKKKRMEEFRKKFPGGPGMGPGGPGMGPGPKPAQKSAGKPAKTK